MSNYDYERDEVIRQKKKVIKPKTKKSDHKHVYEDRYFSSGNVNLSIPHIEKTCKVCGKVGNVIFL